MTNIRPAPWKPVWLPLATTPILYALYQCIAYFGFDVAVLPRAVPVDLAIQIAGSWLVYLMSRRSWAFIVLQALCLAVVNVGPAIKLAFYGVPIKPDDAASLPALIMIAEGAAFWALILTLGGILALFFGNLRLAGGGARRAVTFLAALAALLTFMPHPVVAELDRLFGNSTWNQRGNYEHRGPALYILQETARHFAEKGFPPNKAEALAAAERLLANGGAASLHPAAQSRNPPRNVHVIVLESFWDANLLTGAGLSADPLDPEFRALWREAGNSHALSPVFGGHTANAEFEVLCGFPVLDDGVVFESRLTNDAPCLPRLLSDAGYRTVASHPNVAAYWNRINAYRRVGFQTYWSAQDFVLDDMMQNEFLSDESLLTQIRDKVWPMLDSGRPVLNYVMTFFGHVPYTLNERRPEVIRTNGETWLLGPYVNTLHYKRRELMAFVKELRAKDPNGIIVMFGDHLPFLGFSFDGYYQSGLTARSVKEFDAGMSRVQSATPLIIIDGLRGPVPVGDMPIYQIPELILSLLGHDVPTIMDYTRPPAGLRIRPLLGMHLAQTEGGPLVLCRGQPEDAAICATSAQWIADVGTVKRDLFRGHRHTSRKTPPWVPAPAEPAVIPVGTGSVPALPASPDDGAT